MTPSRLTEFIDAMDLYRYLSPRVQDIVSGLIDVHQGNFATAHWRLWVAGATRVEPDWERGWADEDGETEPVVGQVALFTMEAP